MPAPAAWEQHPRARTDLLWALTTSVFYALATVKARPRCGAPACSRWAAPLALPPAPPLLPPTPPPQTRRPAPPTPQAIGVVPLHGILMPFLSGPCISALLGWMILRRPRFYALHRTPIVALLKLVRVYLITCIYLPHQVRECVFVCLCGCCSVERGLQGDARPE